MIGFGAFVAIFAVLLATVLGASRSPNPGSPEATSSPIANSQNADVLIFGGTPSGVAAAVSAARMGLKVKLVSGTGSVGGSIANGVGATDSLMYQPTGFAKEFFDLAKKFYPRESTPRIEPHVAEAIFSGMLRHAGVQVQLNAKLAGVRKLANQITCIELLDLPDQCASTFVDASYEGDLFAAAGARYRLGTQDLFAYNEGLAKRRIFRTVVRMPVLTVAEKQSFSQLPFVAHPSEFKPSQADMTKGMPSFTYRFCLSKTKKVAFKPAVGYEKWIPAWRALLKALYADGHCIQCLVAPYGTLLTKLWRIAQLPNGKYDLNSHLGLTNFPIPAAYFQGGKARHRINLQLENYMISFLYWLQTAPEVPTYERNALVGMGLCSDEYRGNHHMPYQPYVREGRRLVGKYTITTDDIFHHRAKSDVIAYGFYYLDNKSSQIVFANNSLYRDLTPFLMPPPYEIPYRVMVPKDGPTNLLVSVGVSASPVTYGSIRMELQYMEMGQAAGVAAVLASRSGKSVANIDIAALQSELEQSGDKMRLTDLCQTIGFFNRAQNGFSPFTCEPRVYENYNK
jgi:hypothetical protein